MVQIKLNEEDSPDNDSSQHSTGVIVNKKVEHNIVKYETRLLNDVNVIVSDLLENDLEVLKQC